MILKLCGFTIASQAANAARLGASHVGIVLWPGSKRAVDPVLATMIAAAVADTDAVPVGVVVDRRGGALVDLARAHGIGLVQLHGDHDMDDAAVLREAGIPFWRALRVGQPGVDLATAARWRDAGAAAIVLDAYVPGLPGGTGARVDVEQAAAFARQGPTVLAGGLTPDTVAAAVRAVRPAGVDVASGIERSPGDKDGAAMARFVEQARAALQEIR
jgi:phosphoribosylanthranilate isomerase